MWSSRVKVKVKSLSPVQLFVTPWAIAYQASPSVEFSRQEYWSGLPFPSPGDLPDPGIEPESPALQADSLLSEPPGKPHFIHNFSGIYIAHVAVSSLLLLFSLSHVQLCNPMHCSTPRFPVLHCLPEFAQTMSIESVMPPNHLILCHPHLFPSIFLNIRVFPHHLY